MPPFICHLFFLIKKLFKSFLFLIFFSEKKVKYNTPSFSSSFLLTEGKRFITSHPTLALRLLPGLAA
jgi:hypothetical protein